MFIHVILLPNNGKLRKNNLQLSYLSYILSYKFTSLFVQINEEIKFKDEEIFSEQTKSVYLTKRHGNRIIKHKCTIIYTYKLADHICICASKYLFKCQVSCLGN